MGWFTAWALLGLLAWDYGGLDMRVMLAIADHGGFGLRSNWWMDKVLHEGARQAAVLVYLGMLIMIWLPFGRLRALRRMQRVEIFVGITLSVLWINIVKRYSLTSCPWDLAEFGGVARYVSHWHWGQSDGGSGQCFPGGHAASAMAFLALCLPWLSSGVAEQRHQGLRMLMGVLAAGLVLGGVQTLRGAHYPSHTLWTGLMCWSVALVNHIAFQGFSCKRATPTHGSGFHHLHRCRV